MKLYEVSERDNLRKSTCYVKSQGVAFALFRDSVKKLKKLDVPPEPNSFRRNTKLSCTVNQVEVNTNLKASDWCDLLTSEAPGGACDVVIGDFITSRKELKAWESKHYNQRTAK